MQKKYLLDTNICISLLKSRYGIREEIINRGFHNCFISEITIAELYYGASKSKNKEQTVKDVDFVSEKFTILPIFPALELFADFKAVQGGNVWCMSADFFQNSMELGTALEELHEMLLQDRGENIDKSREGEFTFLYRLE